MNVFKGEVIREKKKVNKKEIKFSLIGAQSTYHGKKDLINDVKSGGKRIVRLYKDGENIFAEYNGKVAGKVSASGEVNEILEEHIEDLPEVIAIANGIDRGNVLCSLEVKAFISKRKTNIKGEIERIVKKGINTQEEIEEKLDYLKKNNVSKVDIELLFKSYIKYPEEVESRIIKKPDVLYVDEGCFIEYAVSFMNEKDNILFEGEASTGKNVLARTLAWLYNRPLYEFSFNAQHSNTALLGGETFKKSENELSDTIKKVSELFIVDIIKRNNLKIDLSEKEIKDVVLYLGKLINSKPELVFDKSPIVEAAQYGGLLVLDEFNTAPASALTIFHSLLDNRRTIEVPKLGKIVAHKNFCAIATQNRDYVGTFDANSATRSRFQAKFTLPASESIVEILRQNIPEADYDTLTIADEVYKGLKTLVDSGELPESTLGDLRGIEAACRIISKGKDPKNAFYFTVMESAENEESKSIIKNMIDLLIE